MESGGVIADASWSSFDLPLDPEESELMAQLLGTFPSHGEEDPEELPWSDRPSNPCYYQCNANSSASSNGPSSLIVPSEYEGCYLNDSNEAMGISSYTALLDLNMVQEQGATQFLDVIPNPSLNFCGTWNKRKHSEEGDIDGQTRGRKCARKDRLKQAKKATPSEDEDGSVAVANAQSSSCCTSDNDSNASQESPSVANTNGKTRASRRTATAPQSLYARKRRERINERPRILQNLVPNGTKVDLSTMLEEAVHYVKFLQLQIKLLSSDEMWMYAPIAYNGMNVGIDLNISQQ